MRNLCVPGGDDPTGHCKRMVALLVDGLRYGARTPAPARTPKQKAK